VEQQLCGRGDGQECEKRKKMAPFIREEVTVPRRGRRPLGEILLLFMVVTPSSTRDNLHFNFA
jgi:hypothetical protein